MARFSAFASVPAPLRLLVCAGAAVLVGCTSLMEPPPVDVLPTKPPPLPPAAAARPVNGSLFSTAHLPGRRSKTGARASWRIR